MKLNKESIHESKMAQSAQMQITLDRDFIVPDTKPDIDNLIKDKGDININEVRSGNGKATVDGKLNCHILYCGEHRPERMEGTIDFTEVINVSDAQDDYYCSYELSDLTVKAVNSRKVNVKAIIMLELTSEGSEDTLVGIDSDDKDMQMLKKDVSYSRLIVDLKDNFRINESFNIDSAKPEIGEIIWSEADVRGWNTRITDNGVNINGDVCAFVMYGTPNEDEAVQWQEVSVPFSGKVDVPDISMDMIEYINFQPVSCIISAEADYDGENRKVNIEMVLSLKVEVFSESRANLLADIYSPFKKTDVTKCHVKLKKLQMHNNTICQCGNRIKTGDFGLLQICGVTGGLHIDDESKQDDGIVVFGRIFVNVLYISNDDKNPVSCLKGTIPFEQKIVAPGDEYDINYGITALSAVMSGAGEIEVKASVSMNALTFEKIELDAVLDAEVSDAVCEGADRPGMVGIIAGGGESLWDIAKRYHTTMNLIRQDNPEVAGDLKAEDMVKKGVKLLLVKPAKC